MMRVTCRLEDPVAKSEPVKERKEERRHEKLRPIYPDGTNLRHCLNKKYIYKIPRAHEDDKPKDFVACFAFSCFVRENPVLVDEKKHYIGDDVPEG